MVPQTDSHPGGAGCWLDTLQKSVVWCPRAGEDSSSSPVVTNTRAYFGGDSEKQNTAWWEHVSWTCILLHIISRNMTNWLRNGDHERCFDSKNEDVHKKPYQLFRGVRDGTKCSRSPHCLQCVKEVVRLSKLQQGVCLSRSSRIGGTVRDGLKHEPEKPTLLNI
jgi:hypothetical protein